jgi:preprotein translocase subunit YajC
MAFDLDDEENEATREMNGADRKIEVGDYIRTNKGIIGKLVRIERDDIDISLKWYVFDDNKNERYVNKPYIVNYSKNIIDLIEEGDYVNGEEVICVYGYDEDGNDKDGLGICETDEDYAYYKYLEDINIYSIVTKEQFNSIAYRLEE